jgi:putative phosphoribosyl transferase
VTFAGRFEDRVDAGGRLAEVVPDDLVNPMVLGLPRGGVPVAFEVAVRHGAPLEVLVARKVGAPGHAEFGIGAVAEGGVRVAEPASLQMLRLSRAQFDQLAAAEEAELERRVALYRRGRALPPLDVHDVVVVDDGLATGVTAEAAVSAVRRAGAHRVVLAVPVSAPSSAQRLAEIADTVVCVAQPDDFTAVGLFYENFEQTSDAKVVDLLDRARARRSVPRQ